MHIAQFRKLIWSFYKKNKRDLPWRKTTDPYKILVSEIMLQQTQVPRVIFKYEQFIKAFPDFKTLAIASVNSVLNVWSGLGYNRRALYLQRIAILVQEKHKGKLPLDPLILVTLPGIGKATAASIVVFSKNEPLVFIETNIRRVFIHHFFQDRTDVHDTELLPFIEQTLDKKNPREWYYALMDYGSYLAKITENPNRKSKHYAKQSKFEGSLRQVRGKVLKLLLEHGTLPMPELKVRVKTNNEFFKQALEQLEKEKFIEIKNNRITIV